MSASTGIYDRMTAWELVEYFGRLYGMAASRLRERMEAIFGWLQMDDFRDVLGSKMSTGMKQKVSIARTIVHDPPVLIFDEPTSGLDVLVARVVLQKIAELRDQGKTIVFSTHAMHEVEKLCSRVAIIHKGRVQAEGEPAELLDRFGQPDLEELFFHLVERAEAGRRRAGGRAGAGPRLMGRPIRWPNVWTIFRREVRDQLRDRRTLFMVFVLPILLYPILGIGILQLSATLEQKPRTVVVLGAENLPELAAAAERRRGTASSPALFARAEDAGPAPGRRSPSPGSYWTEPEAVREGDPGRPGRRGGRRSRPTSGDQIEAVGSARLPIVYDSTDEPSQITYLRVREVLERLERRDRQGPARPRPQAAGLHRAGRGRRRGRRPRGRGRRQHLGPDLPVPPGHHGPDRRLLPGGRPLRRREGAGDDGDPPDQPGVAGPRSSWASSSR